MGPSHPGIFDFTITYRKGVEHGNADALSRQCTNHNAAVGHIFQNFEELKHQQHQDPVVQQLYEALLQSHVTPTGHTWNHPPLRRYRQLWSQLLLKDGLVCRQYQPRLVHELTTVHHLIVKSCFCSITATHLPVTWDHKRPQLEYGKWDTG